MGPPLLLGNVHRDCGKQFTGYHPITVTRRWLCRGRCRSGSVIILQRRQATTGRAHSSLGSLALTRSIAPISHACGSNLHPNPSNPCGTMPRGRPLTGKQSNNCTMPLHGKCFLCIRDQSPKVMPCNEAGHLTRHPLSGGHQPSIQIHLHSVLFLTLLYHTVISLAPTSRITVSSQ